MVVRSSRVPGRCYRPSRTSYAEAAASGGAAAPVDPRTLRANRAQASEGPRGSAPSGRPVGPHRHGSSAGAATSPYAAPAADTYRARPRGTRSHGLPRSPFAQAAYAADGYKTTGASVAYAAPGDSGRSEPRLRRPGRQLGPRARAIVAVLLCVLVFGGIGSLVLNANARTGLPGGMALFGEPAPTSTPQAEWRQGQMPYLYQTDRAWASEPYAGSTVGEAGCGPTCMSMVYVYLTGRTDLDPAAMSRFSDQNGYVMDGMTAWAFMTDGAAQLGLNASEVPADAASVAAELAAGRPIIASVRPGDFTSSGHFIVLAGMDENGRLIVHDPNSASRSAETWDMDRVLGQCAGLWSYAA